MGGIFHSVAAKHDKLLIPSGLSSFIEKHEKLIEIITCLFLDQQFQGLLVLLNGYMQGIVNYFTNQEWRSSCEHIAKFIVVVLVTSIFCFLYQEGPFDSMVQCLPHGNGSQFHRVLLILVHSENKLVNGFRMKVLFRPKKKKE